MGHKTVSFQTGRATTKNKFRTGDKPECEWGGPLKGL